MLFSLVGLAFATHVATYDVNARWTKAPLSGLESLVVDPAVAIAQLAPLTPPIAVDAEDLPNLAAKGERAIVFTNPLSTWAKLSLNGLPIGNIGPYATMRVDGVKLGVYSIALEAPTLRVRTFAVHVGPMPRVAPPIAVTVKRDRIDLSDKIYFELDSAVILAESFGLLDAVATALNAHPEVLVVRIEGHTDSRGEAAYNQTLSESRAASVRDYLVKAGVATDRFLAAGFGESMPIDPAETETEAAWDANRRVEFLVDKHVEDMVPVVAPGPVKKKKGGK
ncbi:MAG: OmpA family protein [Pseudomonadota bacterium]|nr:OmpA family protein [Pseudomonadota bacterium]